MPSFINQILPEEWRRKRYLADLKAIRDAGEPVTRRDKERLAKHHDIELPKPERAIFIPDPERYT